MMKAIIAAKTYKERTRIPWAGVRRDWISNFNSKPNNEFQSPIKKNKIIPDI